MKPVTGVQVVTTFQVQRIKLSFGWFEWGCVECFLKANRAKLLFSMSNLTTQQHTMCIVNKCAYIVYMV